MPTTQQGFRQCGYTDQPGFLHTTTSRADPEDLLMRQQSSRSQWPLWGFQKASLCKQPPLYSWAGVLAVRTSADYITANIDIICVAYLKWDTITGLTSLVDQLFWLGNESCD